MAWFRAISTTKTIQLQNKTVSPSTSQQSVTADENYDGLGTVTINAIETETQTVTSSRSTQTVVPTTGKYLTSVTVNGLAPTGTFTPTTRGTDIDMGATSNYRYVTTTSVPNNNTTTYNATTRSSSTGIDLGATNTYRYVRTDNVPNANSGTYTFAANDTGGTKDLGATNTYRYVNATNVYNKGKADGGEAKNGTVAVTVGTAVTVNCGYKPKTVLLRMTYGSGLAAVLVYNENFSSTTYDIYWKNSYGVGAAIGLSLNTDSVYSNFNVTSTGFTFKSRNGDAFPGGTYKYATTSV